MASQSHNTETSAKPIYTLHFSPFSLYSLMIRFSAQIGKTLDPESAPNVQIKLVNLDKSDNLSEEYLTGVNPRGQVPSLTSTELSEPLSESRDISTWLCEQQPELVPQEHRDAIQNWLNKFYSYHRKALSIPKNGIPNQAAAMLEKTDLSESHRRALLIKSAFHNKLHTRTVEPDNIHDVEENTKALMQDLTAMLQQRSDPDATWLFGSKPTILDAYATVFTLRLIDLKREELTTAPVRDYALRVKETPEWTNTSHGRPTLWNASLGPVADFNPL